MIASLEYGYSNMEVYAVVKDMHLAQCYTCIHLSTGSSCVAYRMSTLSHMPPFHLQCCAAACLNTGPAQEQLHRLVQAHFINNRTMEVCPAQEQLPCLVHAHFINNRTKEVFPAQEALPLLVHAHLIKNRTKGAFTAREQLL